MWVYHVITTQPPHVIAIVVGLIIAVVCYRIFNDKKWVAGVVSLALPVLVLTLAESCGFGVVAWVRSNPYATMLWGLAYLGCGLLWMGFEYGREVAREKARYMKEADRWCQDNGLGNKWSRLREADQHQYWARLGKAIELINQDPQRKGPPLVFPEGYYKAKGMRFWIICWWFGWPLFCIDFVCFDFVIHLRRYVVLLVSPLLRMIEKALGVVRPRKPPETPPSVVGHTDSNLPPVNGTRGSLGPSNGLPRRPSVAPGIDLSFTSDPRPPVAPSSNIDLTPSPQEDVVTVRFHLDGEKTS